MEFLSCIRGNVGESAEVLWGKWIISSKDWLHRQWLIKHHGVVGRMKHLWGWGQEVYSKLQARKMIFDSRVLNAIEQDKSSVVQSREKETAVVNMWHERIGSVGRERLWRCWDKRRNWIRPLDIVTSSSKWINCTYTLLYQAVCELSNGHQTLTSVDLLPAQCLAWGSSERGGPDFGACNSTVIKIVIIMLPI